MPGTIYIGGTRAAPAIRLQPVVSREQGAKHLRVIYSTWNRASKELRGKETERSHPALFSLASGGAVIILYLTEYKTLENQPNPSFICCSKSVSMGNRYQGCKRTRCVADAHEWGCVWYREFLPTPSGPRMGQKSTGDKQGRSGNRAGKCCSECKAGLHGTAAAGALAPSTQQCSTTCSPRSAHPQLRTQLGALLRRGRLLAVGFVGHGARDAALAPALAVGGFAAFGGDGFLLIVVFPGRVVVLVPAKAGGEEIIVGSASFLGQTTVSLHVFGVLLEGRGGVFCTRRPSSCLIWGCGWGGRSAAGCSSTTACTQGPDRDRFNTKPFKFITASSSFIFLKRTCW